MTAHKKMAIRRIIIVGLVVIFALPTLIYSSDLKIDYDIFIFNDCLTVDFDLSPVFSQERVKSIKTGYPLYIRFRVQLKKHLSLWFDPQIEEYECLMKIEYQSFGTRFQLGLAAFGGIAHEKNYKNIKRLLEDLNDLMIMRSKKINSLDPNDNFYFCFKLELRSLTEREISRASDWYRGKKRSADDTLEKGDDLPKTIFKQLLNLSGLGPAKYEFKSFIFRTKELKIVRP
jgi:hypothetical protein